MVEYPDYGLAAGDVYTAIRLSALFGQMGKKNQVRIGGHYSFEDLRNSPAVVIGAFNNRWTMQMTSNLHFAFAEEGDESFIREEGPSGRRFYSKVDSNGNAIDDYAVVTRLLNSKTGQFVVVVAGIKSYGTQSAGEFVSGPEYLQKTLQEVPQDWGRKNVQIVLQTTVTDGICGPPQVVAIYAW
jgi:phosphomevalonate kinase